MTAAMAICVSIPSSSGQDFQPFVLQMGLVKGDTKGKLLTSFLGGFRVAVDILSQFRLQDNSLDFSFA